VCFLLLNIVPQFGSATANTHLKSLDRVTTFFCNIVKNRVHEFRNLDKNAILQELKLNSLLARRQKCDLVYLYNIMNGRVDSPFLIHEFFIRVPTSTRNDAYFYQKYARKNIEQRSLFTRIPNLYNKLPRSIDFACSYHTLCKEIDSYLPLHI
jgi:hypothetical protein